MINWDASAERNDCTVEWLKDWTDKHPKSNKKVWRVCEGRGCTDERWISFCDCTDLCNLCSKRTPEARKANSERGIKQYSTQESTDAQSLRKLEFYKNHPEWGIDHSLTMTAHWADPENCESMSKIKKESEATKLAAKMQKGGNDICNHHYIYDHADLSKHIIRMTRSMHQKLHRLFQKHGIIIPHINIDNNMEV